MTFDTPIKCGQMYIKFDADNKAEYGFICDDKNISKFINLTDNLPEQIVLPKLNLDAYIPTQENIQYAKKYGFLRSYLDGNVRIMPECFKGLQECCIVVPNDTSIMLDWGCFDNGSKIDFILPEGLSIQQIHRRINTAFDYEYENWTWIGRNGLDYELSYAREDYSAHPFEKKFNRDIDFNIIQNYSLESTEDEPSL